MANEITHLVIEDLREHDRTQEKPFFLGIIAKTAKGHKPVMWTAFPTYKMARVVAGDLLAELDEGVGFREIGTGGLDKLLEQLDKDGD